MSLAAIAATMSLSAQIPAADTDGRSFEFVYRTTIPAIGREAPVHIFLPVPVENEQQSVEVLAITTSADDRGILRASIETESTYGNRYWHAELASPMDEPIEIEARYRVVRRLNHKNAVAHSNGIGDTQRRRMGLYLNGNRHVAVGHPVLQPILDEIDGAIAPENHGDKAILARAIYDWVVDNIEYKKVGTGWGNGDTFWACNERYGNCTDFHSLFISLARTKAIPARFEIGFPIPQNRPTGNIDGYHCWLNFYLPETGWFPVDASEAFNQPENRELYYGTQPLDRIHFSTGRDLRLGPHHQDQALNYFVYPYVEVGGLAYDGRIESSFSYRDL